MTPSALYIGNDLTLSLTGLRKADTGAYLDGTATVAYTITEVETGDVITSGPMTYVLLSSGGFTAHVQSSALAAIVAGRRYLIEATASQDGYDGTFNLTLPARDRGRN